MSVKKVVLAYSGGLDTSVIVKWLQDNYGCEVVTYTANLGQNEELEPIKEKALKVGAVKAYVEDLQEEFLNEYVMGALRFSALYENQYPLATALGRPLITKRLIEIAKEENADAIAHGSTGKGNDQVRFDVSAAALAPDIKVLAPVREWELKSRDDEIEYAKKYNIDVPITKDKPYSIDRNIWGLSVEAGPLEDPYFEPTEDIYSFTTSPENAPNEPEYVTVNFEAGKPVALNGKAMNIVDLVEEMNTISGKHGVGRTDVVENRLVGIKSREIYEAPGAFALLAAKKGINELVWDRETLHMVEMLSIKYAELVYYGYWFHPLREAMDELSKKLNETATGEVKLKLYKGNAVAVARKSPYSIYNKELATYDPTDTFVHKEGEAFCHIWGLPMKVMGMVKGQNR